MALFELAGNMHMHTPYSDGYGYHQEIAEAAIRAGLDFIIVTDHNIWIDEIEGYYETEQGKVLVLSGEEVHNTRRKPQANHFLAYGVEKELYRHAHDPQKLIDATREAGGYGFLAHPFELRLPIFREGIDIGWKDWDIEGYAGLEIWNYMSSFKCEGARVLARLPIKSELLGKLRSIPLVLYPERVVTAPEPAVLEKWDELLAQGKRIAAVGNSDAHATPMKFGPFERKMFPYEFLFRSVNTHVLINEPLSGNLVHDKALILNAIGNGHGWVGYDLPHPTKGFRFSGQGVNKGVVGDEIQLGAGATLQILAPTKAHIRLIRHGQVVAEVFNEQNLTHIPVDPGAYRVECLLEFEGKERGWIYSNPIYLV